MPGRRWTAEEKVNIVLEVLTTTASTAEIWRSYNVRPTWSMHGEQVSFRQVQEVYLLQMHRIEKSNWNRKIRGSKNPIGLPT